ncbi:MAG: DUF1569 domain-containing protein [Salinimicrobium sp.]
MQLNEMEGFLPSLNKENLAVSAVNVGWHISHSLKVINNILQRLENSDPAKFKKQFSFLRLSIFLFGRIPRGKAQAPSAVLPDKEIDASRLAGEIALTRENILKLNDLPKKAFYAHHYFGNLDRNQTVKFLTIHTQHHLKIIRSILY